MRVLKLWALAATVVMVMAGFVGSAQAASFGIGQTGKCPSCYTKKCRQIAPKKVVCECDSNNERGTVTPKFYVTHVVYPPPGKSSTITYGEGSTSGTTTSLTSSFKHTVGVTASASGGPSGEQIGTTAGVKISEGNSWGNTDTEATDITVENTHSRTTSGTMNGLDHGDDEIWFLIDPVMDVVAEPNKTCNGPVRVTWGFHPNQLTTQFMLPLRWLESPDGMAGLPADVRDALSQKGITAADFPEIAKADPFATFNLVAQHSGQCLAVPAGSQVVGQGVIQYPCLGAAVRDQGWRLVSVGNGLVQVIASHSDQCMAVPAGSQVEGQGVIQYPCLGPDVHDQSWRMIPVGDGSYRLQAQHSNKCLAVAGGTFDPGGGVVQVACAVVPEQQWRLRPISSMAPSFASLMEAARPGDSNRFELVDRFPYDAATPVQMETLTRKVTNMSTETTDTSYTSGVSVSGSLSFAKLITEGLSSDDSMTWTNQTSVKQSDGVSTSHQLKIGTPTPDYNGPVFLHVFHDKLWKTYMFVLDDNF
jgi:hypothetical protein